MAQQPKMKAQVRGILYGAFFIYEQASCLYDITQKWSTFINEPVSKQDIFFYKPWQAKLLPGRTF